MEKEKKSRKSVKNTITSWMKILDNNIYSFRYMEQFQGNVSYFRCKRTYKRFDEPCGSSFEQPTLYIAWRTAVFVDALFVILNIAGVKILQWLWNLIFSNYLWPGFSQRMHQTVQVDLFKRYVRWSFQSMTIRIFTIILFLQCSMQIHMLPVQ